MRTKVLLDYDENSGGIYDRNGAMIATWVALEPVEVAMEPITASTLIKLKESGYTADEIVELRKGGLL